MVYTFDVGPHLTGCALASSEKDSNDDRAVVAFHVPVRWYRHPTWWHCRADRIRIDDDMGSR